MPRISNREKFARALEQAKQGYKHLRLDDTCYCALGVLCEVYRINTGRGEWGQDRNCRYFMLNEDKRYNYPQQEVLQWARLTNVEAHKIYIMNDMGHTPFNDIAAYIRSLSRKE